MYIPINRLLFTGSNRNQKLILSMINLFFLKTSRFQIDLVIFVFPSKSFDDGAKVVKVAAVFLLQTWLNFALTYRKISHH